MRAIIKDIVVKIMLLENFVTPHFVFNEQQFPFFNINEKESTTPTTSIVLQNHMHFWSIFQQHQPTPDLY